MIFIPGIRHALEKLCSDFKYVAARDAYYKAGRPEGFYDSAEAVCIDAETEDSAQSATCGRRTPR